MRREKGQNLVTTEKTHDEVPEKSIVGGEILKTLLKDQRTQSIVIFIGLKVASLLEVVNRLTVDEMDKGWMMQINRIIIGNGELQVVLDVVSRQPVTQTQLWREVNLVVWSHLKELKHGSLGAKLERRRHCVTTSWMTEMGWTLASMVFSVSS